MSWKCGLGIPSSRSGIPDAAWSREWGDEFMRVTASELGKQFRRWCRRERPFWWQRGVAEIAYRDGFEIGARAAFIALEEVRAFVARGEQ